LRGGVPAQGLDRRADQREVLVFLVADVLQIFERRRRLPVALALGEERVVQARAAALEGEALAKLVHEDGLDARERWIRRAAHRVGFGAVGRAQLGELALVAARRLGELHVLHHLVGGLGGDLQAGVVHADFGYGLHGCLP
jgi:hypothetical protein